MRITVLRSAIVADGFSSLPSGNFLISNHSTVQLIAIRCLIPQPLNSRNS
jgi:hypothetical protein